MLLSLIILPFWTSFLIRVYAWIALLKPEGLINAALLALGVIEDREAGDFRQLAQAGAVDGEHLVKGVPPFQRGGRDLGRHIGQGLRGRLPGTIGW